MEGDMDFLQYCPLFTNPKSQVTAVNKYDPPLDVVAARDHMTHLVYQLMQPQVLYDRSVQIYSIVYYILYNF